MGAKVVLQFNMYMEYIWVGVYNILLVWNGDFINVVNIVMNQCITCEVNSKVKYPWRWMISMEDSKFLKEFKNKTREEWFISLYHTGETLSWELSTKLMVEGYVGIRYIWMVHRSKHIKPYVWNWRNVTQVLG